MADIHSSYRASAISQAEPVKLVEMLYEGALRFITRAQQAIATGDPEDAHNNILRAYAVIAELMATLDFEQGGDIAVKLEQCYEFMLYLLKEADIRKDPGPLTQVEHLLTPMLTAWREAFAPARPAVANRNGADHSHGANTVAAEPAAAGPRAVRRPVDVTG